MLILHGDNITLSRGELEVIKKKNKDKEIVVLDGKTLSLTQLKEALEAKSLFSDEKLLIIENFLGSLKAKNLGPKSKNQELDYLLENTEKENLILWEDKEINKNLLSLFRNAKIKLFRIERLIFSFVESLRPRNTKVIINFFRRCLENNPPEVIFSMIIRQFRLLILVKSKAKIGPSEYLNLSQWQKQRLTKQANFFTMEELEEIYQKLLDIDYKNKIGKLVFDLRKTVELFLTEI